MSRQIIKKDNGKYAVKTISIKEYSKKMDKIIKMGHPVGDTLVEMLEEAAKYSLKSKVVKKRIINRRDNGLVRG